MAKRGRPPGSKNKDKKIKKVHVSVFKRGNDLGERERNAYELLDSVIDTTFPDLSDVKIDMAWRGNVRQDADGNTWLTKLYLKDEMNRQDTNVDVVIQINKTAWSSSEVSEEMKLASLDFSLCEIRVHKHEDGEIKRDENKRPVLGRRKPASYFPENVRRHGLWNERLKEVIEAAHDANDKPLLKMPSKEAFAVAQA